MSFVLPERELAWLDAVHVQDFPDKVYLVGGTTRDILLGRTRRDFDLVSAGDPRLLARRIAAHLHGAWFVLDEQRLTVRVVVPRLGKPERVIDVAAMQGGSIEADLRLRDFTINAIALDLRDRRRLIDPLGGQTDLRNKHLRLCSPQSIQDDPLRLLRGIRLAVELDFRITPETLDDMRPHIAALARVSPERIRDELFRMLDNPNPAAAFRAMQTLGVLDALMPELSCLPTQQQGPPHVWNVWDHTLAVLDHLEALLAVLAGEYPAEGAGSLWLGMAVGALGRYRTHITDLLSQDLNSHRTRRALLFFAALLHDVGKPDAFSQDERGVHFYRHAFISSQVARDYGKRLALSNEETAHLACLTRQHMRIHFLVNAQRTLDRRVIYRFFRATGEAGVEICLLSLADTLATYGPTLTSENWQTELDICRQLLEAWWLQREEVVAPQPLLNGHDLMTSFGVSPGPRLGALLHDLTEAQAAGEVGSRQQALEFARQWLLDHPPEPA
ncbi:MAG: CCA tRNA nucleotidyltransferase [Anaerolineae bacterium]|nr:CCA tRNA nucleotidyltransferase [Anaerolineae bacterium]